MTSELSLLERLLEILHPLIVPYLDYYSTLHLRSCSRKLNEIMHLYHVEPDRVFYNDDFLPFSTDELYRNRWIKFWAMDLDDEVEEVPYDDKILLYVKEWTEITSYHDETILIARGITKWGCEVPIPSEYDGNPIESRRRSQWCLKSFYVDLNKSIAFYSSNAWAVPKVYRLHSDYEYDGRGYELSLVSIPVWYTEKVGIPCEMRHNFTQHFLEMDSHMQDIEESHVVHDIIDPDLFPRYFPDNTREEIVKRMNERLMGDTMDYIRYFNTRLREVKYLEFPAPFAHMNSVPIPIREHYHWVPSDVEVLPSGKVVFLSPIHGVEDRFQAKTQQICAHIFQKMIPLFEQADIIKKQETTKLQVIVKAQRYELQPFSSYKGKWHVEGLTENILYGGIYYLDQDPGLKGGGLKFRNSGTHELEKIGDVYERDIIAEVGPDTAIVFSNIVPHRLVTLVNNTNQIACRTFINFFVVDPEKPLVSSSTFVNTMDLKEAKSQRARHRAEMSIPEFKFGFAHIKWGNSGTLEFLDHTTKTMCEEYEDRNIHSDSSDGDFDQFT
jgi:hypothetical protein